MRRMNRMVLAIAVTVTGCGVGDAVETSTTSQALTGSNGIWENGLTTNGIWENGIWENGIWENGIWENGVWDGAVWHNGTWLNGIWESGVWRGNRRAHETLRDNPYARQVLQYLYSCAMPPGASTRIDAGDGVIVDLEGGIGLWPTWAISTSTCEGDCADAVTQWEADMPGVPRGECDETCQRWLSACLLARTNAYGVRVEISMRAPADAPLAIQRVLAVGTEEAANFTVREGAFYGNLFQTYPDATGRIVNNPVLYACAGPGSNIPQITNRFCSSQGASGVITNTGICEPTAGRAAACAEPVGDTERDCAAPTSGLVPATRYREVITVYLRQPIATCGNSVCEPCPRDYPDCTSAEDETSCPTDCHPGSWAKTFDQVYLPSEPLPQHYKMPVISTTAISPVDNSVVVIGAVHAAVAIDLGGGTLAATGTSHWDLVLAKYDRDGRYLWARRMPQLVRLEPGAVAIDSAGNIAVAAEREGLYSDQAWIGKFDPDGNILAGWPRTYGGEAYVGVGGVSIHRAGLAFDGAGNLLLASKFAGTPTFGAYTFTSEGFSGTLEPCCLVPDAFVLALAPDGAVRWARPLGGARVGQLAVDSGGNVALGVIGEGEPHRLVKLAAADGALQWSRGLPTEVDESVGVATDPATGDVFVTGRIFGDFDFGGGTISAWGDLYVAKYTAAGGYAWARLSNSVVASGPGWAHLRGSHLAIGPSGDVLVLGDFITDDGGLVNFGSGLLDSHAIFDLVVMSYRRSDGATVWSKHIPAVLFGMGHSMKVDGRGHIVLAGHYDGSILIDDRLLVNGIPELTMHQNVFVASFPPPGLSAIDLTPPTLDRFPEPLFVQATSSAGARVWYMPPTAHDAGHAGVSVYCAPAPDSIFPRGTTIVTCTATDPHGNAASGTFPVTVGDTLGPVISGVAPVVVPATSASGAIVTYAPAATDQVDGARAVGCSPASGTTFPLGTTTVRCASTDASGNTTTRSFPVTVVDKTPPVLTVPGDMIVFAPSTGGAVVTYAAMAYDAVDGVVGVSCKPASQSLFPLGVTLVTCAASDKSGNQATAGFRVHVQLKWSGVLQPVNADGSSVFKLGSVIPVKFALTGESAGITNLKATWNLGKLRNQVTGTVYELSSYVSPDSGNVFRYDVQTKQYVYNLPTKLLSVGDWKLAIHAGDGVTRTVRFSLLK